MCSDLPTVVLAVLRTVAMEGVACGAFGEQFSPQPPASSALKLPPRLPSTHTPRLLGSAWVDGRRDGSPPPAGTRARAPPSRRLSAPAGGIVLSRTRVPPRSRRGFVAHQPKLSGVDGARAGAGRRKERRPGHLDEVGKLLSHPRLVSFQDRPADSARTPSDLCLLRGEVAVPGSWPAPGPQGPAIQPWAETEDRRRSGALHQVPAIVHTDMWRARHVQRVQDPHGIHLTHPRLDFVASEPLDRR